MAFLHRGTNINSIKVAIAGAGRMGQAIEASVDSASDLSLVGVWRRNSDLESLLRAADIVIDFSLPEGTERVLEAAVSTGKPLVCGVSGLSEAQDRLLSRASEKIALVYDRNMSTGIAVLEHAVREAAAALGEDFAVQVSETHHVHKKDAPSGTALKLAEAIAEARGEQGKGSVKFEVERIGDVPGDHEVIMRNANEMLTFAHSVTTRQVFVDGAIRATRWLVSQDCGRYSMQDVLFGHLSAPYSQEKTSY